MQKAAFTMIELIFVIVILGILASFVISKFGGIKQEATLAVDALNIKILVDDLSRHVALYGSLDSPITKISDVAKDLKALSAKSIKIPAANRVGAAGAPLHSTSITAPGGAACLHFAYYQGSTGLFIKRPRLTVKDADDKKYCNLLLSDKVLARIQKGIFYCFETDRSKVKNIDGYTNEQFDACAAKKSADGKFPAWLPGDLKPGGYVVIDLKNFYK